MDILQGTIESISMQEMEKAIFPVYRKNHEGDQMFWLSDLHTIVSLRNDKQVRGIGISKDMPSTIVFDVYRYLEATKEEYDLLFSQLLEEINSAI